MGLIPLRSVSTVYFGGSLVFFIMFLSSTLIKEACLFFMQGGPILIPGFCLPKALQPVLPIYLQASSQFHSQGPFYSHH